MGPPTLQEKNPPRWGFLDSRWGREAGKQLISPRACFKLPEDRQLWGEHMGHGVAPDQLLNWVFFFFYFLTQNTGDKLLSGHYGRLMAGRNCWLLYHLLMSPFSSLPSPPCRDKVSALCSLLLQEKLDLVRSFNCQKVVFKVACTPLVCCLPLLSEVKVSLADVFQAWKVFPRNCFSGYVHKRAPGT